MLAAIADKNNPVEKLKAYFYARMRTMMNLSNFYDAMKNELFDHLPFINETRKDIDQKEYLLVKSILEEGINKGIFDLKDIDMTVKAIVIAMKGLEIPLFVENKVDNLPLYIDTLVHIICYGLIKK